MLSAKKSRWFEEIFAVYNKNLFRRRFHSLQVAGLENLRKMDRSIPLVLYANHSSWWDGLTAFEIGRRAHLDHFVMMEERQLEKLFLFRRLGAFSVVRENPRQAVKSINYAVGLLNEKPNRALWIFPQGEILPNDARPLKFYQGAARIVEKLGRCFAVPVAMRYEFLAEFKPDAFARAGEARLYEKFGNAGKLSNDFAGRLTAELDRLKADINTLNFDDYDKI